MHPEPEVSKHSQSESLIRTGNPPDPLRESRCVEFRTGESDAFGRKGMR